MPTANTGGAGSTDTGLGWFIIPVPAKGTGAGTFQKSGWQVVQAASAAQQTAYEAAGYLGPYSTQAEAQAHFNSAGYQTPSQVQQQTKKQQSQPPLSIPDPIDSWLRGLGGEIGSGLEAAAVAFLTDLWDVILGPLEILAGGLLLILVLVFAFKNEIMSVAPLIAMMA